MRTIAIYIDKEHGFDFFRHDVELDYPATRDEQHEIAVNSLWTYLARQYLDNSDDPYADYYDRFDLVGVIYNVQSRNDFALD